MTKYKWSLLGLILSIILFIVFLISPLINFINEALIPAEPNPFVNEGTPIIEVFIDKEVQKDYLEWRKNAPKKISRYALSEFGKSFYHWNLFWIPIIVFYFMTFNYKKTNK